MPPESTVTIEASPDIDAEDCSWDVIDDVLTIYAGDTVDLRVTETNTGLDPLTDVWVCVIPQVGCQLTKDSLYYIGGDLNHNGILDHGVPGVSPGETWTWIIPDVVVDEAGKNPKQVKTKDCGEGEDYPSTSNQTNSKEETNEAPKEQITAKEKTPSRYV